MSSLADACRASAGQCADCTSEDRVEFLDFAASWKRLAREIEANERLITLIDQLASNAAGDELVSNAEYEASASSVRRLAAAVLAVSSRYLSTASNLAEETREEA